MEKEVAPVIDEHEREHRFPVEVVRRLGEMGWLGIPIPEDEGGAGMDTLAYAIAVEEIGRVWGSLGLIVAAHTSLGCGPLHLAGSKEQKDRYLVPMASGKVIGAYGLTEPGAGSDAGGTRTTARLEARRSGRRRVGHRRRQAVHHQRRPGRDLRHHRPDRHPRGRRAPRSPRSSCPPTRPGFRVVRIEDKLGLHASATGELAFDRCRVPGENLLGERGDGFRMFLKILDGGRISHRRAGGRDRPGRLRRRGAVRPDAPAVRQADRQLPGRRVHDRRHGDRDRGGAGARLEGRLAQGPGTRLLARRRRRRSSSRPRSAHA